MKRFIAFDLTSLTKQPCTFFRSSMNIKTHTHMVCRCVSYSVSHLPRENGLFRCKMYPFAMNGLASQQRARR